MSRVGRFIVFPGASATPCDYCDRPAEAIDVENRTLVCLAHCFVITFERFRMLGVELPVRLRVAGVAIGGDERAADDRRDIH